MDNAPPPPPSDPVYKRLYAFDSATADRLAATLGTEADPQRLMAVGEAIARCATAGELLREIGRR